MQPRTSWRWPVACSLTSVAGGLLVAYGRGLLQVVGGVLVLLGDGPFALVVGPVAFVVFVLLDQVHVADNTAVALPVLVLLLGAPGVVWGLVLDAVSRRVSGRRGRRG